MERRKRSANQEPVIVLDEEEKMEPIHKLLKLDRDKFKTIQSDMKTKGLVLSQTWSDLYSLMSRYQAELITREDQLIDIESQIDAQRNSAIDNELERMKLQLQAKDREIKAIHIDLLNRSELLAKTQNELGRVKSVLRSKDELIKKLEGQMKMEWEPAMTGDSAAAISEQVTSKTSSPSGSEIDTSSLVQKHLEQVQTNISRSGSDDSGTGAEKSDAKYQVSSSNDEETDSLLPLESDVATINIPGQDSSVLEEVNPGTSATDDTGQSIPEQDEAQYSSLVLELANPTDYRSLKIEQVVSLQPLHQGGQTLHGTTSCVLPPRKSGRLAKLRRSSEVTRIDVKSESGHHLRQQHSSKMALGAPMSQEEQRSLSDSVPGSDSGQRINHEVTVETHSYQCATCGKLFSNRQKLVNHSYIHTGEKPFRCSQCFKQFNDRSNLKRHERLHSGVKAYCCDICGKTFSQISNLKTHRLIHGALSAEPK